MNPAQPALPAGLRLPPDPAALPALRDAATAAGDDRRLLAVRELERACTGLPPVIDGVRRGRLLAADPLATTWEGWEIAGGGRVVLRCLHPRWVEDPVMQRRLARPVPVALPPQLLAPGPPRLDGDWPHLALRAPGVPLIDRLPAEDPPDRRTLARILGAGLAALDGLHRAGRVHGGNLAVHLLLDADGVRLAWLDGFAAPPFPARDLAVLGQVVAALDPDGIDPVGGLAAAWADDPPPSAADGLALLQQVLAGDLLAARHRLAMAGRRVGRQDRAGRLGRLTRRLHKALPPPVLAGPLHRACLHAHGDGRLVLVESDGAVVRGGTTAPGASPADATLPALFHPRHGLDAQVARALLRAWAGRDGGDPAALEAAQDVLGQGEPAPLMRWLQAMASLRRSRLLLEHQARPVHRAPTHKALP